MVLHGQYLERPAVIACGDVVLDGLYHRGDRAPAVLVCAPTGAGGGMDAPAAAEVAWACARAGHPSLRFHHRGQGGSSGAPEPARALDDARAALAHLAETARLPRHAVVGIGAGCATAAALARAAPRDVDALVLVGPGGGADPAGVRARALVVVPEHGPRPAPIADAAVEIVPGADPLFRSGLTALGRAVVAFLGG
jgi:pimeloyl-ACP methyl ester carboxylesterase